MKFTPSNTIRMKAINDLKPILQDVTLPEARNDQDGWMISNYFTKKNFIKLVSKIDHKNIHLKFILQGHLVSDDKAVESSLLLSTIAQMQWIKYPEQVPFAFVEQDWKETKKSTFDIKIFKLRKYSSRNGLCVSVGEPQEVVYNDRKAKFVLSSHAIDRILERCELPKDYPEIACCLLKHIKVSGFASNELGLSAKLELTENPLTDMKFLGYSPVEDDRNLIIGKTFLCPFMNGTEAHKKLNSMPRNKAESLKLDRISSVFSKAAISEVKKTGFSIFDYPTWCSWLNLK